MRYIYILESCVRDKIIVLAYSKLLLFLCICVCMNMNYLMVSSICKNNTCWFSSCNYIITVFNLAFEFSIKIFKN